MKKQETFKMLRALFFTVIVVFIMCYTLLIIHKMYIAASILNIVFGLTIWQSIVIYRNLKKLTQPTRIVMKGDYELKDNETLITIKNNEAILHIDKIEVISNSGVKLEVLGSIKYTGSFNIFHPNFNLAK